MTKVTTNLLIITCLLALTTLISLPLTKSGLHTMHDDQQIARLFVADQALKSGQFPVRWVDSLGFGFGYPLFVFYPPLVYWLGEIFHLVGFSLVNSIKLVFAASVFFSGLAIYILAREFWGKLEAFMAAAFYMFVPYRALDIYVRGALAESFSFVPLPIILWSFYKLSKSNKAFWGICSALSLALLMVTHSLIFLPFMLILPIFLLLLLINTQHKKKFLILTIFSFTLAFGLTAFFWLPAIVEKKYTIVDQLLLVNLASYKIHFVYPQQLWDWIWGFGGSAAGLADGISFKIGKIHIITSIAALTITAIQFVKTKRSSTVSTFSFKEGFSSGGVFQLSIVFFILFVFSTFMTTQYSEFIWEAIPQLGYLQFPWRFLTFIALFSSLLAAAFIYYLRLPIIKLAAAVLLLVLLILPNLKLFRPQSYRLDLTDDQATTKSLLIGPVSNTSFEYLPKGIELYTGPLGTNLVNISAQDIPTQKIEVVTGQASTNYLKLSPTNIDFEITARSRSTIIANNFNFPGWQVKVDGKKTLIDDNNRLKLITFDVPTGTHHVSVEFKDTPIRKLANLASLFSLIILLIVLSKKWLVKIS